jgi:hypothetical protein
MADDYGVRPGKPAAKKGPLPDAKVEQFLRRYQSARRHWSEVASLFDELYEFCLPLRERPFGAKTASARKTDRLFDSTAPVALADFASQRVEDVWPTDQKPIDLLPGRDVPPDQQEAVRSRLADVATLLIEEVNNSNFREAAVEASLDYGVATGVMLIDEGDALDPLKHRALPLTDAILGLGPYGEHDALYRARKVKAYEIPVLWPNANLSESLRQKIFSNENPDQEVELVEGYYRDWTRPKEEVWVYCCVHPDETHELVRSEASGIGSKPFVSFSFMRVPNETYGRGPAQLALPDVRSLNVLQELLLEHLDMAVGGLWSYESDGVMNVDAIQIQAGTVIPKMRGSAGLESVEIGGNPQFGAVERDRLQQAVERVFFKLDLGPTDKTPKSATEILQRVADRAGRLSGPNSRLVKEFLFPYVRRALFILKKKGLLKLPALDRGLVNIRPLAPITRAQAQDDILRHVRFAEFLIQTVGPQVANLIIKGEDFGVYLGQKMGVEPRVIRTTLERQQLAKVMAQLAATAAQQEAA